MFKISKLTDYGVMLLRYLAANDGPASARDLARCSALPLPTVSKLLKILAKHKVISATRGVSGGYELLLDPQHISVLKLIEVFEGPPALISCLGDNHHCQITTLCPQKDAWWQVHQKIATLLSNISLSELIMTSNNYDKRS
jgi:FeS assembly SUF system regulator